MITLEDLARAMSNPLPPSVTLDELFATGGRYLSPDCRYSREHIERVAREHNVHTLVLFYEVDSDGYYEADDAYFLNENESEYASWLCERLEHVGHTTTIVLK